jgi:hypothetical protein
MDIYKCPKMKNENIFPKKNKFPDFCDHNEKLASGHQKNKFYFVTVIFFIIS